MRSSTLLSLLAATAVLTSAAALAQAPVPRPTPVAGSIVAAKGGEELRLVRDADWRAALIRQDLVGGDALRTNAIGNLAILFADQTQVRVGRLAEATSFTVRVEFRPTELELEAGNLWARASRGGTGVTVKTPAASAAIRGTDWSLTVDRSGRTALVVMEGVVELRNAQGSVTVRQGEAATASIGQAPVKVVLARPKDREQMLFYLSLRDVFEVMRATPSEGPDLRAEHGRLRSLPPEARRAADWLALAETSFGIDGRPAAAAALAEARARPLDASQRARADLVEALLAGSDRRWKEAAALFARAERGVTGRRRLTAAYGRYIAASLADPTKVLPAPKPALDDPYGAGLSAFVTAFAKDLETAADELDRAAARHGGSAFLASLQAQAALAVDRRDVHRAAVARAIALDPDSPDSLKVSAGLKGDVDGDLDGALADLARAAEAAPGDASVWNAVGLVQGARDAGLEAEAALRRAIALDPGSPVAYANLAILLLDQSRVEEAGALVERALELEPGFHAAYTAKGRYFLQKGEMAKAMEFLLAGSAANPAYANGLLAVAIAHYQAGDVEVAQQALDNAERLDPNDPVTALARTAIALDQLQADRAIEAARDAVRRFRARGGYFSPLATTRQGGSYLSSAYRLLGLEEWGRFYGDRVFDPFSATGYFDQAISRRTAPALGRPLVEGIEATGLEAIGSDTASGNLAIQGLLLDPLAVAGRLGRIDLLRRPFVDGEVGVNAFAGRDRARGRVVEGTVTGFSNAPWPTSFYINGSTGRFDGRGTYRGEQVDRGALLVGMQPTAADRVLLQASIEQGRRGERARAEGASAREDRGSTAYQGFVGWSHTFGHRHVLQGGVYGLSTVQRAPGFGSTTGIRTFEFEDPDFGPFTLDLPIGVDVATRRRTRFESAGFTVSHLIGFGDFTLRSGVEGQSGRSTAFETTVTTTSLLLPPPFDLSETETTADRTKASLRSGRLHSVLSWRPSDRFELEGGAFATLLERGGTTTRTLDPRIGVGFSPLEGHWLRAAWRRDTEAFLPLTLSPVTTVGLVPNLLPTRIGSRTETLALRWDAEWTPRFFTAVEYQRQTVRGLDVGVPETFGSLGLDRARIERVTASANAWLGGGIGVFGTVGAASSENLTPGEDFGRPVPFVAERFARAGLVLVHPSRLRFTLAHTVAQGRTGDLGGARLADLSSTDAAVSWETPDRRLVFGASVLNIFDRRVALAPGVPGSGRTFGASVKARF